MSGVLALGNTKELRPLKNREKDPTCISLDSQGATLRGRFSTNNGFNTLHDLFGFAQGGPMHQRTAHLL